MRLAITRLVVDDAVESKLAEHGVTVSDVRQVIGNKPYARRNRRATGRIECIGRTDAGRLLLVSLAETDDPGAWRPVTAYDAPREARTVYERHGL